jgi:hypothetical protein
MPLLFIAVGNTTTEVFVVIVVVLGSHRLTHCNQVIQSDITDHFKRFIEKKKNSCFCTVSFCY